METKHTGPPWGVRIGTTHNIIAAQGDIICVVERKTVSRLEEEQDANSHLMADAPTLQARIDRLEAENEAARAEAFAYGRCCDLYQDSLGQFHCHDCGQRTFAMLQGVQRILGDGTEVAMSHEESVRVALIRKTAPETITRLEAEKAELIDALQAAIHSGPMNIEPTPEKFESVELLPETTMVDFRVSVHTYKKIRTALAKGMADKHTFDGYSEAEKIDNIIAALMFQFPIDRSNFREWLIFSRTISSGLHIIEISILNEIPKDTP